MTVITLPGLHPESRKRWRLADGDPGPVSLPKVQFRRGMRGAWRLLDLLMSLFPKRYVDLLTRNGCWWTANIGRTRAIIRGSTLLWDRLSGYPH